MIEAFITDEFSPRELRVLHVLVLGKSNKEIAETLGIGLRTVESHVHNMLSKTGLKNRTQLTAWYLQEVKNLDKEFVIKGLEGKR